MVKKKTGEVSPVFSVCSHPVQNLPLYYSKNMADGGIHK